MVRFPKKKKIGPTNLTKTSQMQQEKKLQNFKSEILEHQISRPRPSCPVTWSSPGMLGLCGVPLAV